jgi:hypothetical protein
MELTMSEKLSIFLDDASEYLAARKGLLPLIGIVLVLLNLVFQIFPIGWLTTSNLFLHIGIVIAILGVLLARAL